MPTDRTGLVQYTTDRAPTAVGVYACRVPSEAAGLLDDVFLMWSGGEWFYLSSDQKHRGEVIGWIGPLQRRVIKPRNW